MFCSPTEHLSSDTVVLVWYPGSKIQSPEWCLYRLWEKKKKKKNRHRFYPVAAWQHGHRFEELFSLGILLEESAITYPEYEAVILGLFFRQLDRLHTRGGNSTRPGIYQRHQLKRDNSQTFRDTEGSHLERVSSPDAKKNSVMAMIQYHPNRYTAGGGFFSRRYGFISTMKWIIQTRHAKPISPTRLARYDHLEVKAQPECPSEERFHKPSKQWESWYVGMNDKSEIDSATKRRVPWPRGFGV